MGGSQSSPARASSAPSFVHRESTKPNLLTKAVAASTMEVPSAIPTSRRRAGLAKHRPLPADAGPPLADPFPADPGPPLFDPLLAEPGPPLADPLLAAPAGRLKLDFMSHLDLSTKMVLETRR